VVPRSSVLFGWGTLLFGGETLNNVDVLSVILIVLGAAMVYGVKYFSKLFKMELTEIQVVIVKLAGLVIACIGFFRILDII
jgi:TRAP-type C4-dicarboxylate transport system permease small subunit